MKHIKCPVCGYDKLTEPLKWSFCPSCGTEFGYSDRKRSYDALRADWIRTGAEWDSTVIPRPLNWSPVAQFKNIGYQATREDLERIKGGANVSIGYLQLYKSPKPKYKLTLSSLGSASDSAIIITSNFGARILNLTNTSNDQLVGVGAQ